VSQTPERIEREMFEIRSRMSPDVTDLRKHVEPQVVAEKVKRTVRQRIKESVARVKASLRAKGQEFVDSGKRQISLAREAGEKRDPTPFTDAVRSYPRPLALLSIRLAITLFPARKTTGNRGDRD